MRDAVMDQIGALLRDVERALPDNIEGGETPDLIAKAATLASWLWVVALLVHQDEVSPEIAFAKARALMKERSLQWQLRRIWERRATTEAVRREYAGWALYLGRIWRELVRRLPARGPGRAYAAFHGLISVESYKGLVRDLRIKRELTANSKDRHRQEDLLSACVLAGTREAWKIRIRGAERLADWLKDEPPPPRIAGQAVDLDPPWDRVAIQLRVIFKVAPALGPIWGTTPALSVGRLVHAANNGVIDEFRRERTQKRGGGRAPEMRDVNSLPGEDDSTATRRAAQRRLSEAKRLAVQRRLSAGVSGEQLALLQSLEGDPNITRAAAAAGWSRPRVYRYLHKLYGSD